MDIESTFEVGHGVDDSRRNQRERDHRVHQPLRKPLPPPTAQPVSAYGTSVETMLDLFFKDMSYPVFAKRSMPAGRRI